MAPAPEAAAGLVPKALVVAPPSVPTSTTPALALDEPKPTAGLQGGVVNAGNALPGQGNGGNDGGLGGFLTGELGSILGIGGAGTSTTSTRATTANAQRTTTSTTSSRTTSTTTSARSTSTTTTTTRSSTTTTRTTTSTSSTTTSSSLSTANRGFNQQSTSDLTLTFPTTLSSAASPTNGLDNANISGASTSSGLSKPAMIGIIVAASAVGLFILLFFLRKLCLSRRRRERIQWEEGLASYNAPPAAGSSEKVEAEVVRRLNANVVAPLAPIPAALPRQQQGPRSPTSVTKRPMMDEMYRSPPQGPSVQMRGPVGPPSLPSMVGPYPTFVPSTSPPSQKRFSSGSGPLPALPPSQSFGPSYPNPNIIPPTAAVQQPPPSLSPAQGTFKTVLTTYSPQLPDELPIAIGERIRLIEVFEDGWAMVERVGPGQAGGMMERGVVPAECLGLGPGRG